jgi:hypothetical protein
VGLVVKVTGGWRGVKYFWYRSDQDGRLSYVVAVFPGLISFWFRWRVVFSEGPSREYTSVCFFPEK